MSSGTAWAFDPALYSSSNQEQRRWAERVLPLLSWPAILRNSGPEVACCDIGCGDGGLTVSLARVLEGVLRDSPPPPPRARVLGCDISPQNVEHANSTWASKERNGLSFVNLSFEVPFHFTAEHDDLSPIRAYNPNSHTSTRLQTLDVLELARVNEFDLVFSSSALHWVPNHRAVCQRIARALKPGGGTFLAVFHGASTFPTLLAAARKTCSSPAFASFFGADVPPPESSWNFETAEAWTLFAAECGLEVVSCSIVEDRASQTPDALASRIRSAWVPFTLRVPADLREDFVHELVATALRDSPDAADAGKISIVNRLLHLQLRRP
jgi:SAM-dependent methyltransferase